MTHHDDDEAGGTAVRGPRDRLDWQMNGPSSSRSYEVSAPPRHGPGAVNRTESPGRAGADALPLSGVRILEFAGVGPAPFAGMMLADAGADVLLVERFPARAGFVDILRRGKRSIVVDLKRPEGAALVRGLVRESDGLIEGFRPGVMERLGIGPDECRVVNPKLVYGRMTGWGQDGPLAHSAGHDIDFIALTGVLDAIGRSGAPPTPPLNLVADFGGGGMLLAFGMVSALLAARATGLGRVIDAAMVDGSALLMAMDAGMRASGIPHGPRGTNMLDSGAPYYDVYETSDGSFVAVGAVEPAFYRNLLTAAGLDDIDAARQNDRSQWPAVKSRLARAFRERTRAEWEAVFERTDACAAPVLSLDEAVSHPHLRQRGTWQDLHGYIEPAPAPRYDSNALPPNPVLPRQSPSEALAGWGSTVQHVEELVRLGVLTDPRRDQQHP